MESLVPWAAGLGALIEPHYPKAGVGRPPIGLQRMLRIDLLHDWFNLADEAMGRRCPTRRLCVPWLASTWAARRCPTPPLLRFRHLMKQHRLDEALFAEVSRFLRAKGLKLSMPR
jgi:IS5 family transposase